VIVVQHDGGSLSRLFVVNLFCRRAMGHCGARAKHENRMRSRRIGSVTVAVDVAVTIVINFVILYTAW
jgi:hypothetical protein